MNREFSNVYGDRKRAEAYADLGFPGTYYLGFRDLPGIVERYVRGNNALDFGCGTGRSTRFLKGLGFDVVGVDISQPMLSHARELDPAGDYLLIPDGDLGPLEGLTFDLVLSTFVFDNVPSAHNRIDLFKCLGGLLNETGRMVHLVSAAEIYVNEWTSFSTKDFPENATASPGELVHIVMLDVPDRRPVEDVFWTDADYRGHLSAADLTLLETHRPLGRASDPYSWVSETQVSPWAIYVAERRKAG